LEGTLGKKFTRLLFNWHTTFFSVKIGRIKQGHHGLGWSGKIAKIISKINGAKRPGAWLKW
jgi:hypothetical protein